MIFRTSWWYLLVSGPPASFRVFDAGKLSFPAWVYSVDSMIRFILNMVDVWCSLSGAGLCATSMGVCVDCCVLPLCSVSESLSAVRTSLVESSFWVLAASWISAPPETIRGCLSFTWAYVLFSDSTAGSPLLNGKEPRCILI